MTLDAAEKARVPVVRGLEWGSTDLAVGLVGVYQIEDTRGGFVWSRDGIRGNHFFPCREKAQAKAAAQSDYEQRVLSALNPDFLSALDTARAEIERLTRDNKDLDHAASAMSSDLFRFAADKDRAESALTAAQEQIAELEGALKKVRPLLVQQVSRVLQSVGFVPRDIEEALDVVDATLSPAVKEPK